MNTKLIGLSEERFEQKGNLPFFNNNPSDKLKDEIYNRIYNSPLVNLATVTPKGWPIVHCMHFTVIEGENKRPIVYMFTHDKTRKLANIPNDGRVSVSIYNTPGYENRKEAWMFQFLGVARLVEDPEEIKVVTESFKKKPGNEETRNKKEIKQPCIRVDILTGTYMSQSSLPPVASFDYGALTE